MPEIIEKDGVDVEVFTAEEVAAKEEAARNAVKAELDTTKAELVKVNEELKKLGDKDHNFANLRTQKEELEKKLSDIQSGVNTQLEEIKKAPIIEYESEVLNNLSSGDEELKKKIKFHYDRLSDKADNKESVNKKMNDAYLLAVGNSPKTDLINRAAPVGGGSATYPKAQNAKLDPGLIELGKKMGLTDEDMK